MKLKLYSMFIVVFSVVASLLGTIADVGDQQPDAPKAMQGVLDLRQYSFPGQDSIKLDGEWEFVPGKMADSKFFTNTPAEGYFVSVPLLVYFVVVTLNVMGDTNLNTPPPFLPFIYLLMLSLFMANRFADTYRKNEELSTCLLRVDQLKDDFLAIRLSIRSQINQYDMKNKVEDGCGDSARR